MGYEIKYMYHPRKEEGGYNTEVKEEKIVNVGKPFDDTPLEKCAAAIMMQLARRDVWVVDVKVHELVRAEISFKESADGKGIVLKNKKYALGSTAEVLAEDLVEVSEPQPLVVAPMQGRVGLQPHEIMAQQQAADLSSLYDGNRSVPVKKTPKPQIDQNKRIYYVYFDPLQWIGEAKKMKLKFTDGRKYPVHAVIPKMTQNGVSATGDIAVTDDAGRVQILDEKFFTAVGRGLIADDQLGFSGSNGRDERPKLLHEDELTTGRHPAEGQQPMVQPGYKKINRPIPAGIPVDDGSIPEEMFAVPDLRPGKKY